MKKYLVLLLALTMLVSCCTGCGKTAGVEADSETRCFPAVFCRSEMMKPFSMAT